MSLHFCQQLFKETNKYTCGNHFVSIKITRYGGQNEKTNVTSEDNQDEVDSSSNLSAHRRLPHVY